MARMYSLSRLFSVPPHGSSVPTTIAHEGTRGSDDRGGRGQVLVIFALSVVVFLGVAALVVDFGSWLQDRRTLQNAADAAALVGVNQLRPPIGTTQEVEAVQAAIGELNRQLGLGISAANLAAAATAASSSSGLSAASGVGYTGPDVYYATAPPNPDCGGPGAYGGNVRAITVRIDHVSGRFFSRLYTAGTQHVGVCATASDKAGGYAVAVLKPSNGTTQANNANLTFVLDGANTIVTVSGGNVGVNATYAAQGNPCSNPVCHTTPAYVQFMTAGNQMELGLLNPTPLPWTISPAQVRDPIGNYLAPTQLSPLLSAPGWGPGPWLDGDGSGGTYDPTATPVSYDGRSGPPSSTDGTAGTCVDPADGSTPGLKPGNYSQIQLGNSQRLWLCPGVFHIVNSGNGQQSLIMAQGSVLAGQGVTLAFEADAPMKANSGSLICLNPDTGDTACNAGTHTPAPWTTGGTLHDVPIAVWIRPVADCDPLSSTICSDSSDVFQMNAGAGIRVRGIIYGPSDNIVLAGQVSQRSTSGEVWAWTLEYAGGSVLDQVYDGPDVSHPLLVQ
jgi:hypothetical protein